MNFLKLSGLLFLFFLTSCNKDDDNPLIASNAPYVIKEMQWMLKDGDGEEILEKKLPDESVINDSDALSQAVFAPLKKMEGSSRFQFELPKDISIDTASASQLIPVPNDISLLSDQYAYIGGGIKVPFQKEVSTFPFSFDSEESVELQPYTQAKYQSTLFLRKNTATFKATLVQPETQNRFELTGKWTGEFYQNLQSHLTIDELN